MASSTCSSASAADSTYSIPNQPQAPTSTPTIEHPVPSFKDVNKSTHPSDFKASTKASSSTNSNSSISHKNQNNVVKKFSAASIDLKARIEICLQSYTKKKSPSSTPSSRTDNSSSDNNNTESNDAVSATDSSEEVDFIEKLFTELLQFKYAGNDFDILPYFQSVGVWFISIKKTIRLGNWFLATMSCSLYFCAS